MVSKSISSLLGLGLLLANQSLAEQTEPNQYCGGHFTPIHNIQGSGAVSPLNGREVTIEGVVSADFQSSLNRYFVQSLAGKEDNKPETSEGLAIDPGNNTHSIKVGDHIRLRGLVQESGQRTQLKASTDVLICGSGVALPNKHPLQLPFVDSEHAERFENMLVSFEQLTVNDVYPLLRHGSISLAKGRRMIPTQIANPGEAANKVAAANRLNSIILDDGSNRQNPKTLSYFDKPLSAKNALRVGDTVSLASGILDFDHQQYRIQAVSQLKIDAKNTRPKKPKVGTAKDLTVASFNVLNFFNTLGERGADTPQELKRQLKKLVSAINGLEADIVGLMEIENDGFGKDSAIADLLKALNKSDKKANWKFVRPQAKRIGDDAITVGFIYRGHKVSTSGPASILNSQNSVRDRQGQPLFIDRKNRPSLAQKFLYKNSKQHLVVAVNHFKSKGSNCDSLGDPNIGDGQGNCNKTRSKAAKAVAHWLEQQYSNEAVLVIGDLNAYAKEDPLKAFAKAGFADLSATLNKSPSYSYIFRGESGQLDHALANAKLLDKVVAVAEWHINADEPKALDYNVEHKSRQQIDRLYAPDAYRASDHDPVIIAIDLEK